ncbi:MAG: sigma 54-interacting transcriptional regulator, partial [Nitrospirota bacterium]|nr:sigma 54-interacting transcriptional regulator [Nitrospirota bacterium]
AHKGTLFLDEIGDMPLAVQAKLLRVLQEKQFYPVGAEKPLTVDVRVIAATNKDLGEEVRQGNFREDLYYRIHVIPIDVPPLRERKEDIPLLATHFLKKINERTKKDIRGFASAAMKALQRHDWPGNVRQLENVIEYSVAMSMQPLITEELILQAGDIKEEGVLRPLREAKDEFEKRYLEDVLRMAQGNVSKAASLAGKYRADFYSLLKKYDLRPDMFKD